MTYCQERLALLSFLKLIFQPTDPENKNDSRLSEELEHFRNVLVNSQSNSAKQDTWISKLFKEIEASRNQINKLRTQLTSNPTSNNYGAQSISHSTGTFNFGSTSTPPQRAQEKSNKVVVKFSDEIVQRMLEQHQAERHSSQQWTASATMTERLTKKRWLVQQVKAVALLQWCLFLGLAYQQDPPIEHETQIWEDLIDQMVMSAIHNGAFPIMVSDLLAFKKKDDLPGIEKTSRSEAVDRIDRLMITFVTSLQSILRRLRNQGEDVHVSMRYHSSNPDMSESPPAPPHHDIEALFKVIAAPIATLLILR
ncbi:hypothetical protein MJO29_006124 [Puccinia striiformis f. sp. tritici]|nr:hypothetical protein MJO29_006124 [Puccinia striiformis f. sp. tritici]